MLWLSVVVSQSVCLSCMSDHWPVCLCCSHISLGRWTNTELQRLNKHILLVLLVASNYIWRRFNFLMQCHHWSWLLVQHLSCAVFLLLLLFNIMQLRRAPQTQKHCTQPEPLKLACRSNIMGEMCKLLGLLIQFAQVSLHNDLLCAKSLCWYEVTIITNWKRRIIWKIKKKKSLLDIIYCWCF